MRLIKLSSVARFGLVLLTLLLSIALRLFSPTLTTAQTHANLAFISLQGQGADTGNYLFSINADGSNRRNLAPALKDVASPLDWSTDGRRLAFVNEADIYVVNADGSGLTQIFDGEYCKTLDFEMAWLSNNRQIAFTRSCDGSTLDDPGSISVYLSDTTGTTGTQLIQTWQTGIQSRLHLSPDGKQVAFVKDRDIYKMNTDGSGLTNLTNKPDNYTSGGSRLVWSSDSIRIAFYLGEYPKQQLYIMNADGTTLTNLTNNPENQVYNLNLLWSPDSTRIAYYHSESESAVGDKQNIYLIDAKGGTPTNLTQKIGEYHELSWSPDGKQLAFAFGDLSNQEIYAISVNGSKLIKLTAQPVQFTSFAWSPDSQKVAFTSNEQTQNSLYVVNQNGLGLAQLTTNSESAYFPSWQP
jgi:Tol biopolymer transport system component